MLSSAWNQNTLLVNLPYNIYKCTAAGGPFYIAEFMEGCSLHSAVYGVSQPTNLNQERKAADSSEGHVTAWGQVY